MLNIFIIILLIVAIITIICLSIVFIINNKNNIPEISHPPVEEESDTLSIVEDEPPQKEKSILDSISSYEDHIRSLAWGSNNKAYGSDSYTIGWSIPENNHSKYIVRVNNKALLDDSSIYDTSPKEGDLALDFSTNTTYMFNGMEWNEFVESTDEINVREIQF